jgi:DNA-binding beta-propeller fold protein YncE
MTRHLCEAIAVPALATGPRLSLFVRTDRDYPLESSPPAGASRAAPGDGVESGCRVQSVADLAAGARHAYRLPRAQMAGCAAALFAFLVLGIPAAVGLAALAPQGRLVQAPGSVGCVHKSGIAGCTRSRAVTEPEDVAIIQDGRHADVAIFRSNAVAAFARDRRTGALRQLAGKGGCVSQRGAGSCAFGRALARAISVAVSPDGRNVYVASTGSDALAVFARNSRTGALRQLPGSSGCISQLRGGGCVDGRALNEPIVVIVSPDGKRVYLAARQHPSAVAVFERGRAGALMQRAGAAGCISQGGRSGCVAGRGLTRVWDIAATRDGRHVYAAGTGGVAVLSVTADGLSQAQGKAGCVARATAEGCARGRALNDPTGVSVSPDGGNVYVTSFVSDAVAAFRRTPESGALVQLAGNAGCISQAGGGGCAAGRVLDGAHAVAVSPDGLNLYVTSEEVNAISVFARNPSTGLLRQLPGRRACLIRGGVLGCAAGRGLTTAVTIAFSPDGRTMYVGSADRRLGAIGIFRRLG